MKKILDKVSFLEDAETRLRQLLELREVLGKWLSRCPEGKIHIVKSKKRIQYYLRKDNTDKSGQYISKEKQSLIRTYVQKAYNEKAVKILDKEIRIIDKFVQDYSKCATLLSDIYSDLPDPVKELVNPIDISDDEYVKAWESVSFTPKRMIETSNAYITDQSEIVRSKSELNIANCLKKRNIPYRYECPLEIRKGVIIHPDFTALNVRERKIYYWEHRGMMDDREYAQNSVLRIKEYESCGIFPGKGLIITEETLKCPLGTKEIMNVIDTYLL
ncbi:MAG: hypothetical protein Q4B03_03025 [Lachnospiraceae bacterium]|nr:hypothetical protein [Lachnospiraceae bacterium]